jgi:hypothetical protein
MRQAPPQARRIVFLNQADGSDQMAMADKVIDALERLRSPAPARIAVAHLKPQPCLRAIKTINIKKYGDRGNDDHDDGQMSAGRC